MKKILVYIMNFLFCIGIADAAVRDGTALSRTAKPQQQSRISSVQKRTSIAPRSTVLSTRNTTNMRQSSGTNLRTDTGTKNDRNLNMRSATRTTPVPQKITARATTDTKTSVTETKTGAAYEQCKTAYFTCMDQFCTLKSDDYRRCSCNDRVFDLIDLRNTLQDANNQLQTFNENLEVVGMTYAQASAMRQESEGEAALTDDKSASKALLQAIMNSIRGEDTNVGGKYSDLNSINISFDTANAFGMTDSGLVIATYNGQALYQAVYPQCRQAVKDVCNDSSLQRAVTAYLMAIEQDCNTVLTAIESTQKQLKSAVREGSAMLDLARVENRKKHNSSSITACINEVEKAILSEEVCGANYHRCLDNGEYIDVSTGAPIAGVKDFYNLGELLAFSADIDMQNQKLSKINSNRTFVSNFENRTKKFAEPALDKCTEDADFVWSEYLDKAMLDIHYAQKSKVQEIKQGCFDFVSNCYINSNKAITNAMASLTGSNNVVIKPDQIVLSTQMCADYVESCNNLFGTTNIISDYIDMQTETDNLTACRAVVQQCFDKYGGTNYENFYYPYSGLFLPGNAPDWFTLYEHKEKDGKKVSTIISPCAKQLNNIDACKNIIEQAFGGFDKVPVKKGTDITLTYSATGELKYGIINDADGNLDATDTLNQRYLRPTGVATEMYNQILSVLSTQCNNLQGRFIEPQFISGNYDTDNQCIYIASTLEYKDIIKTYGIHQSNTGTTYENMCPRDYGLSVDIESWGMCSCWENGARRSQNGQSTKCETIYYDTTKQWKDALGISNENQVCVSIDNADPDKKGKCLTSDSTKVLSAPLLPQGIYTKTDE